MQQHRETAETGLREVWAYLVLLRTQKFFGEVTLKFREGVVIGHVHEHRDHLVTGLPQATAEEIEAQMNGPDFMKDSKQVVESLNVQPPRRINRSYDKDNGHGPLDDLAKIGQKQGDTMTAALKRAAEQV